MSLQYSEVTPAGDEFNGARQISLICSNTDSKTISRIKMQCAILFLFPISLQFGQQIGLNWVQSESSESADMQKVFDATQAHFELPIDPLTGCVSSVTTRQSCYQ